MLADVRDDIVTILTRAHTALRKGRTTKLKELSNYAISNASVYQDENSVSVAVIIYALSKIFSQRHQQGKKWRHHTLRNINSLKFALQAGKVLDFRELLTELFCTIGEMDERLQLYIEEVIRYAEIKKGSAMYGCGISMARTAHVLGISEWELASCVGNMLEEGVAKHLQVERLHSIREVFGIVRS